MDEKKKAANGREEKRERRNEMQKNLVHVQHTHQALTKQPTIKGSAKHLNSIKHFNVNHLLLARYDYPHREKGK